MIESLYQQYAITMDFEYLTIKTFQKIIQSQYQAGDKIPLDPTKMEQKVELETFAGQKKVIKLPQMLPGFPISYDDLKQFAWFSQSMHDSTLIRSLIFRITNFTEI